MLVERRIALGPRAEAVIGECRLMLIDEGHGVALAIRAQRAPAAQRQFFKLRQEFALHEIRHVCETLRISIEGGMNVEAGASAWTRRAVR